MTADEKTAKWLEARGWYRAEDGLMYAPEGLAADENEVAVGTKRRVIVQSARDAEREAAAWVQFAAAGPTDPNTLGCLSDLDTEDRVRAVAQWADAMLLEYRARFGREANK